MELYVVFAEVGQATFISSDHTYEYFRRSVEVVLRLPLSPPLLPGPASLLHVGRHPLSVEDRGPAAVVQNPEKKNKC